MSSLLLVSALKDEVVHFKAKMTIDCTVYFKPAVLYRGKALNKELSLLVTGMGSKNMEKGLREVFQIEKPAQMMLVGCAGGASPVVSTGTLILAPEIVEEEGGGRFKGTPFLLERAKKLCGEEGINFKEGNMVMVDRVIRLPHEKACLGVTHKVLALDMESAALAKMATQNEIPFLVAKTIFDPMEIELEDLQDCLEPTGEVRPLKMVEHIFKNPKKMISLPKMQYLASQTRNTIAKFLEVWVSSL